jgi:hypothetical protein
MSRPPEQTLAEQLREMIVSPACVELIEQAAARLDDLERDLFIEREAFKAEHYAVEQLERQLATVVQAERSLKDANKFVSEWLWSSTDRRTSGMAWLDEYKADAAKMCLTFALAPHAAKEPGAAQTDNDGANLGASGSNPHTAPTSGPDGEDCTGEPDEQFIEAILVEKSELSRLRTVAEAAKAWLPYCYAGTESSAQSVLDNFVAAVRALERGEVKS